MKTRVYSASFFLLLAIAPGLCACQSLRAPSMSGDPAKMSSDMLCYRAQTTGKAELKAEAARRNLDCRAEIENDPLLTNQRY
ncbi:MAG TPA: hypothetical protein PK513_10275 [Alphaproteobacteria bacterium]|nr:hypothetical protein [Alphaproteobacteria bacterium]USO05018.1 MAG: hypothetical protein H6859_07605 [Rhodospirillales bacterium]HOO82873.1 hypothetical protein [Alphaproteobacteria bacterium]